MNRVVILALLIVTALAGMLAFKTGIPEHNVTQPAEIIEAPQSMELSASAEAATVEAPLPELEEYIQKAMRDWQVPGLAIAIVKDDQIALAKGYGLREIGKDTPVDEHTLFAIGSATKAFTAAALGMLVDEGKLNWDDKVIDYLPDFQLFDPWVTREFTIRDLLTHRSGLERADILWYGSAYDRDEILRRIRYLEPSSSFRSRFGYQNIMYLAAGQVVEAVSGMSWDEFVKQRIFEPLGMTASNTSVVALEDAENVATPHAKLGDAVEPVPYRNIDNIAPAGSINSNVVDMAQWVRMQLGQGTYEGQQLLSPMTVREMHTPQMVLSPSPYPDPLNTGTHFNTYGLGWIVQDYRGEKIVQHGGNIDGMSAQVAMIPEKKLGLVILTNMNGSPLPSVLMYKVFDVYLNAPSRDWNADVLKLAKSVEQQIVALRKQQDESRVKDTTPSLSLDKYTGTYTSKVYGAIQITEADGKLLLRSPDLLLAGELEHWHYETFRIAFSDRLLASEELGHFLVTFTLNEKAEVTELTIKSLSLGEFEFQRASQTIKTAAKPTTEILWDTWGVPHIFAPDAEGIFYGFGWAQMQSHGNLLLTLYGQARGRAAEYWGKDFLVSDRAVHTMGLYERARTWYQQQSPQFRNYLNAFASGINDYAKSHADKLDDQLEVVLPVTATDVLAHAARIIYVFLGLTSGCSQVLPAGTELGSNGWAIGPARSESGNAMLLANPHLPWSESEPFLFYEAQLTAPGIYDAYGVTLVGVPVLAIAFNDNLGWTHTVNTIDACDLYALTPAEGGYMFDGEVRPFETRTVTIKVKGDDGKLGQEKLTIRRSIHGPVVEQAGKLLAMRMAAVDATSAAGGLEQWWDMARAQNLDEFESALKRLQVPMFTVIYADRDGHIMSLFNGQVPVRAKGDASFWAGTVAGDTSETLWTKIHSYDDLPKVLDPPSGWVQNSNSPPWYTTFPLMLNPNDYPPYMAAQSLNFREQRAIGMLDEDPSISFEEMIADKFSTRMELADRILDDLIAAAREYGSDLAKQAADVLEAWDRQANADSRGAALFSIWVQEIASKDPGFSKLFAKPWDAKDPLKTPTGLANAEAAAAALDIAASKALEALGALDVPWGEIMRLRRGTVDLPGSGGSGGLGIFRVISYTPDTDGRYAAFFGDTFIAAVEFSTPLQAQVLLTYGNATQPGSPHIGDQLELYARDQLRPAWRTREEILQHLELRETLR